MPLAALGYCRVTHETRTGWRSPSLAYRSPYCLVAHPTVPERRAAPNHSEYPDRRDGLPPKIRNPHSEIRNCLDAFVGFLGGTNLFSGHLGIAPVVDHRNFLNTADGAGRSARFRG